MYEQRLELGPDESAWPHRIMGGRRLVDVEPQSDGTTIRLKAAPVEFGDEDVGFRVEEESWEADLVIAATGYRRDAHVEILRDTWPLLPKATPSKASFEKPITGWNVAAVGEDGERKMAVGRDYQVQYQPGTVDSGSGIWLQGCCEGTHGVSWRHS